jgi:hypothetical protein
MKRIDVAEGFSLPLEWFLKKEKLLSGSAKAEHSRFCSLSRTLIFQRAGLNYRIEL